MPTENDENVVKMLEINGWEIRHVINIDGDVAIFSEDRVLNTDLILRSNRGYDFGAFRDVLLSIPFQSEILFLNSSMWWDVEKLQILISKIELQSHVNEVTYLTESIQLQRHGQSFFIYTKVDQGGFTILQSFFTRWIRNTRLKRSAVNYGEMKMASYLEDAGFGLHFEFPYYKLKESYLKNQTKFSEKWIADLILADVPLNPCQHFWFTTLGFGFPGIKKTLISLNPARLEKAPSSEFVKTILHT